MSDDIQKETERIHEGIVASLSFIEALAKRDAEIERLRELVDACAIYLKEDETPAQRIERERVDTDAVLKLLLKEKREVERLREGCFAERKTFEKIVADQYAQIERLRGEMYRANRDIGTQNAQIERLRGLIDGLRRSHLGYQQDAEAEFTKLRALIRERLDGPPIDYGTTHANVLAWDNDWLRRAKEVMER